MAESTATERDLEWIKKTLEKIESAVAALPPATAALYVTKAEFEPNRELGEAFTNLPAPSC